MAATFGFTAPGGAGAGQGGCWSYDLAADAVAAQIQLRANDAPAGALGTAPRCGPLPGTGVITLTLNGDGSSARATSGL